MKSKFHRAEFYGDPLGQAIKDYFEGETSAMIKVLNSAGEDEEMPVEYFFRDATAMPYMENLALTIATGEILDAGAGSGCHSLQLQEQGKIVTALEISGSACEIMIKRGVKKCLNMDLLDLKNLRFDTILLLMNGAGMAKSMQYLTSFLKHLKGILNPGGAVLLESTDIHYMYLEADGSMRIDLNKKYYGDIFYQMIYKEIIGRPFEWLYVDYFSLESAAMNAGMHCEKLFEEEDSHYLAKLRI